MADNPFDPTSTPVNQDSILINENLGVGTRRDKTASTFVNPFAAFNRLTLQERANLFRGDAFIQRLCSAIPAKAATRGWYCKISDDNGDEISDEVEEYRKKIATSGDTDTSVDGRRFTSLEDLFRIAQTYANYQDGCLLVLNIDDGRPPDQPINHEKVRRFAGIELVNRRYCRVVMETASNPLDPTHYEIISFRRGVSALGNPSDRLKGMGSTEDQNKGGMRIHCSRVIRFDGTDPMDEEFVIANDGWYGSVIDMVWDYFKRWRTGQDAIGSTIGDSSLFIYKLKGLRNLVASGKQGLIERRLLTLTQNASMNGGVALDMEDEIVEFASRQQQGVADLLESYKAVMVGATGLPHTILLGESPSGLGATGESEQQQLQELVTEEQFRWKAGIERIYRLIFLCKEGPTKGKMPKEWDVVFRPLKEQNETERINNLAAFVNVQATAIGSGFLTADEARSSYDGEVDYSFKLDEKSWKEQKAKEEASMGGGDFGGGDMGYGAPAEGEAPPEEEIPPEEEQVQTDSRMDSAPDPDLGRWTIVTEVPDYETAAWTLGTQRFLVMDSAYAQDYIRRTASDLMRMDQEVADRHGLIKKRIRGKDGVTRTYWVKKGELLAQTKRKYFGGKSYAKGIHAKEDPLDKKMAIGVGAALALGTVGLVAWESQRQKEMEAFDRARRGQVPPNVSRPGTPPVEPTPPDPSPPPSSASPKPKPKPTQPSPSPTAAPPEPVVPPPIPTPPEPVTTPPSPPVTPPVAPDPNLAPQIKTKAGAKFIPIPGVKGKMFGLGGDEYKYVGGNGEAYEGKAERKNGRVVGGTWTDLEGGDRRWKGPLKQFAKDVDDYENPPSPPPSPNPPSSPPSSTGGSPSGSPSPSTPTSPQDPPPSSGGGGTKNQVTPDPVAPVAPVPSAAPVPEPIPVAPVSPVAQPTIEPEPPPVTPKRGTYSPQRKLSPDEKEFLENSFIFKDTPNPSVSTFKQRKSFIGSANSHSRGEVREYLETTSKNGYEEYSYIDSSNRLWKKKGKGGFFLAGEYDPDGNLGPATPASAKPQPQVEPEPPVTPKIVETPPISPESGLPTYEMATPAGRRIRADMGGLVVGYKAEPGSDSGDKAVTEYRIRQSDEQIGVLERRYGNRPPYLVEKRTFSVSNGEARDASPWTEEGRNTQIEGAFESIPDKMSLSAAEDPALPAYQEKIRGEERTRLAKEEAARRDKERFESYTASHLAPQRAALGKGVKGTFMRKVAPVDPAKGGIQEHLAQDEQTEGTVYGGVFGISKEKGKSGRFVSASLTHIPTGMAIVQSVSADEADKLVDIAAAINSEVDDLNFESESSLLKLEAIPREILQDRVPLFIDVNQPPKIRGAAGQGSPGRGTIEPEPEATPFVHQASPARGTPAYLINLMQYGRESVEREIGRQSVGEFKKSKATISSFDGEEKEVTLWRSSPDSEYAIVRGDKNYDILHMPSQRNFAVNFSLDAAKGMESLLRENNVTTNGEEFDPEKHKDLGRISSILHHDVRNNGSRFVSIRPSTVQSTMNNPIAPEKGTTLHLELESRALAEQDEDWRKRNTQEELINPHSGRRVSDSFTRTQKAYIAQSVLDKVPPEELEILNSYFSDPDKKRARRNLDYAIKNSSSEILIDVPAGPSLRLPVKKLHLFLEGAGVNLSKADEVIGATFSSFPAPPILHSL